MLTSFLERPHYRAPFALGHHLSYVLVLLDHHDSGDEHALGHHLSYDLVLLDHHDSGDEHALEHHLSYEN